jgi:hypothetical protein
MKASEYLLNKKIVIGKKPSNIWNELKILDKTFIDKEELKNNILQKIFKSKKYPLMTIKEALIISDIEEEILKLFKESDKK